VVESWLTGSYMAVLKRTCMDMTSGTSMHTNIQRLPAGILAKGTRKHNNNQVVMKSL